MLKARPVVTNKFWVVESDGRQVATIQAAEDGVVLVEGEHREKFATLKLLRSKYNISLVQTPVKPVSPVYEHAVHDYPCDTAPFNPIFNIQQKLPLYTKSAKSKSYYCAGYYLIKYDAEWKIEFCPKRILLIRHPRKGPYHSIEEAQSAATK